MKNACHCQVVEVEQWLAKGNLSLVTPELVARTLVQGFRQRWKK